MKGKLLFRGARGVRKVKGRGIERRLVVVVRGVKEKGRHEVKAVI